MKKLLILTLLIGAICSCSSHFISNKEYRTMVEKDFLSRKDTLNRDGIFDVFDKSLSKREKEAMMFLYAYMPLGDLVDYPSDLYLKSLKSTLATQKRVSWGKDIPEDIFRHFVLPIRVNNEYLDSSRYVLFAEIYPRIKNMSLHDAVLEVNHWCHEKMIYRPTNSRTSSALASMKTGFGRCGEESVFAVAALRSVGIPARQVYTPRWAHTDDNHAWVEVWVDGKWHYMGACEPEPELNVAWFSKTAQRALLMHTKAFGKYNGIEPKMQSTDNYTEINVTDNYTETASSKVKVIDETNKIVIGANISFRIYNYAEFYPVLTTKTDSLGVASILAGKGDLIVWASKGNKYGFKIISVGQDELTTLSLDRVIGDNVSQELNITPPKEGDKEVLISDEKRALNSKRLEEENVIRENYTSTFINKENAIIMAKELGYNPYITAKYIEDSQGNWQEIAQFLKEVPKNKQRVSEAILGTLLDKDLRDVKKETLFDHINHSDNSLNKTLFNEYILSPRVLYELPSPYKEQLQKQFDQNLIAKARQNPQVLVSWVKDSIKVDNNSNSMKVPILPIGVFRARAADENSRNIFFVALCRSFGIPSRIEAVSGKVQFYDKGWKDVSFENKKQENSSKGTLRMRYNQTGGLDNPLYDSHFTISKYENGEFKLLNFRNNDGFEGTTSYKSNFSKDVALDTGYYMLCSGIRMASGKVLSMVKLFNIKNNAVTNVELIMREDKNDIQVIGNINPEQSCSINESGIEQTILEITGRGYFVIAILGAKQEPTSHLLRDIAPYSQRFEKWGRKMIMLFKDQEDFARFNHAEFPKMPSNMVFGVDNDQKVTEMISESMKINNPNSLPIVIIADTFGRVVYFSQGYKIGEGEQLLRIIDKL